MENVSCVPPDVCWFISVRIGRMQDRSIDSFLARRMFVLHISRVSGHSLTLLMKNSTTTVIPGSEAFFALMHLESDAVVHASCLSTTMPLLCCHQPSSDWQYHPDLSKFSRVDCTKASLPVYTFKRNTTIPL